MDRRRLVAVVLAGILHSAVVAAEDRHVFLNWDVSYSLRSPLGVSKRVITINGRLPGPLLNLTTNDVAHVNVINTLDEPFLLTWYVHVRAPPDFSWLRHLLQLKYLCAGTVCR